MNRIQLFNNIIRKRSYLCVGLDTEYDKIPVFLKKEKDPVYEFNKRIIKATHPYTVACKINTAFYEARGSEGWITLEATVKYIKKRYPDIFVIADAKRGDIGNSSRMYSQAFLQNLNFDAVTVAPYMGEDSVLPFLSFNDKWAILLALTSNKGSDDFQYHNDEGIRLFERVLTVARKWGSIDNLMFVVGATRARMIGDIRKIVPDHFLLIPGVGAQGGSLAEVSEYGLNNKCGLLINSSRGIIFADNSEKFDKVAGEKARELQMEMEVYLSGRNLV